MHSTNEQILAALQALVGLKLTFTRSVVDMRCFSFGDLKQVDDAVIAAQALHVLCPWRIEKQESIITGRSDYYDRADDNNDPTWRSGDPWGNRQDQQLAKILGTRNERGAIYNSGH